MSMKSSLREQLLKATLTGNTYTSPTTVYMALYSTAPTATTAGTELSGDGYARETVTFTVTADVATTSAAVEFGPATADWSTVRGWAVLDASTGGNQLYAGSFSLPQLIRDERTLLIQAGDFTIQLQ
jgi:hypothetical protein